MTENAQEYLAGLQKTVAVSALIEKAMAAKKALESQNAIVERVAHQRSEFAKAFGTTSIDTAPVLSHLCPQRNPGDFVSIAEMNRTVSKNGSLRVAAYIRVSTDSADQENSYETQDKYFKQLLSLNPKWVCAGVYSDYGISGTSKQKRTGYQRILRHCLEGKIDRIVCKSISRFARNTSDFIAALDILHESHVTILFEKEGLDTADSTSDFILTTLAAIAQEESRSISSNILWGIQKRYPKGQVRNYGIYGYRFAKGEGAMETLEDGYQIHRVEVVEKEAKVVRRIFHAVDDGMSYADVARMLNFEHIKAPNHGKPPKKIQGRSTVKPGVETGWTVDMISRMVSLERYCGDALLQKTYTPDFLTHKSRKNKGEKPQYMVRDHHPAIIDRELFESVQIARKINAARCGTRGGERRKRAFSGRLSCPHCGRNYNVRNTGRYPIWFCPTMALNNGKSICHAEKIYEEQIVRMFRKAFIDRFRLLAQVVMDDVKVADIMSGRYGEDEEQFCQFSPRADDFVSQISQRLENIQKTDFMERDRGFLKRQMDAREAAMTESICRARMLRMQKNALETRRRLQTDSSVKEEDLLSCTKRLEAECTHLTEVQEEKRHLEERLAYLERYWEQVEYDYEERERALAWIKTLPRGQEGTVSFLNGLTSEYVKAFALSITVHDPFHYTVHWFDDTKTNVEMYSNLVDYRYTSDYFDGHRMRQKCKRKT
ncbi:MAG: recombinase family protein [Lachnospiraceae bacterium]|nr:recombinase family protein [Lachnospiraceae bacterium]